MYIIIFIFFIFYFYSPYIIPAESKNGLKAAEIELVAMEKMPGQSKNFTFTAKCEYNLTV